MTRLLLAGLMITLPLTAVRIAFPQPFPYEIPVTVEPPAAVNTPVGALSRVIDEITLLKVRIENSICDQDMNSAGLYCNDQTGDRRLDTARLYCQEYGMDSPPNCKKVGGCPREYIDDDWRTQCETLQEQAYDIFRQRADKYSADLKERRASAREYLQQYFKDRERMK